MKRLSSVLAQYKGRNCKDCCILSKMNFKLAQVNNQRKITSILKQRKPQEIYSPSKDSIGEIKIDEQAIFNLAVDRNGHFIEFRAGEYAIYDDKQWFFIHERLFYSQDDQDVKAPLLICSCPDSSEARERLNAMSLKFTCSAHRLIRKEEKVYCKHRKAVVNLRLIQPDDICEHDSEYCYEISEYPLTYAVKSDGQYGVVVKGRHCFKCKTCRKKDCCHIEDYKTWCGEQGHDYEHYFDTASEDSKEKFTSISKKSISYGIPDDKKAVYRETVLGRFPDILVPEFSPHVTCLCGNKYDPACPVDKAWLVRDNAVIYDETVTRENIKIYYRETLGDCDCKQYPDGCDDFILNLDNKYLFFHGYLYGILYSTAETSYPLKAALRINRRRHKLSDSPPPPDHLLRRAYNVFLRLLDIDMEEAFRCHDCGKGEVIVLDGVAIGCKRTMVKKLKDTVDLRTKDIIEGSQFRSRLLVPDPAIRSLLGRYAGYSRGSSADMLSEVDNERLLELTVSSIPELHAVLLKMGPLCDESMKQLMAEFSKISPACGIFQIAGNMDIQRLIEKISRGKLDISSATNSRHLSKLQARAPILAATLINNTVDGKISRENRNLLKYILKAVEKPFIHDIPADSCYGPPLPPHPYEFFPNNPVCLGPARYASDKKKNTEERPCRKDSLHHKVLLPGLFTVFCPHQICKGFSLMLNPESPKTAFDVILRRFTNQLDDLTVVYDNCCNLHQYTLNREPKRFQKTQFRIDRLHYKKGHPRCSYGYDLDSYKAVSSTVVLNSQVCEQANADLRRISKQLIFITAENLMIHAAVFLAMRNMEKKEKNKKA